MVEGRVCWNIRWSQVCEGELSSRLSRGFAANVLALIICLGLKCYNVTLDLVYIHAFMALPRPLAKILTCHNCQRWILRSFIAGIGGQATLQPFQRQHRGFSRTATRLNEARGRIQKEEREEHPLNEINDEVAKAFQTDPEPETMPEEPSQDRYTPWYLQVQQPVQQPKSPVADRQKVPEVPEHPPSILQPLIEHVSIELGIDDISLLDLRSLDPPPALGANLLMIIGTARSEKHLHVSADRLCRWLRSTYKMSPYADGLLGRNELKLKMRRKAKRSKLLSAVGAKATGDGEIDDGIRTGWVCVNLGRVDGGELPESKEKVQRAEGIVGFGARTEGCNVVVQMMTEEKRSHIDLEKLWVDMLNRAKREKAKESMEGLEGGEVANGEADTTLGLTVDVISSQQHQAASNPTLYPTAHMPNQGAGQQLRAYHTSARRTQAAAETQQAFSLEDSAMSTPIQRPDVAIADSSIATMTDLLTALCSMPHARAFRALGDSLFAASPELTVDETLQRARSEEDAADTPFIRSFYQAMPAFPGPQHWHMHIQLLAYARQLGHRDMHTNVLTAQLTNMQIAGLIPEERTFKLVLRSALAPLGKAGLYDGADRTPSFAKMHAIFNVLEDMEACGYNPVAPDILELLYQACIGQPQPRTGYELSTIIPALGAARLNRHIRENDWPSFWRTWRSYPQRFLPRTAGMYRVLFDAVGDGKLEDVREAIEVMRTYLPEMEREEPAVVLEDHVGIVRAAMRALEFVEPKLRDVSGSGNASREWNGWYERCGTALSD